MSIELNSYPTLLNDASLQAYWRFEGNSNDSKNSNNGTDTNVTYGTSYGKFGQGASYNGTSSYTNIPYNSTLRSMAMTLNFWIRRTQSSISTSNHYNIIGKILVTPSDWTITIPNNSGGWSGNRLSFNWYPSGGIGNGRFGWCGFESNTNATTELPQNIWTMVTITRPSSGLAANSKMYINGSPVSVTSYGTTLPTNNQNVNIPICGDGNYYFGADLDDVSFFNRELTATEISDYYNYSLTSIKSYNSLEKSSIKSINGLAIGSIKSINGLT